MNVKAAAVAVALAVGLLATPGYSSCPSNCVTKMPTPYPPTASPTPAPPTVPPTPAPTLPSLGDWSCVAVVNWNVTLVDNDGDGQVSLGDCLALSAEQLASVDFSVSVSVVSKIKEMASPATFTLNKACGGLLVAEVHSDADASAQSDPDDVPPAELECPGDSMAINTGGSDGSSGGGTIGPAVITVGTSERGVGVPVSTCSSDQDKDGALCYPKCRSGYYGVGPVCYASCPSGWDDQGLVCAAHSYAPGSCAIQCDWMFNCGCPSSKPHNCASVCYESCREGYSMPDSACGFCKADGSCPSGTTNVAGVCWKNSYGRGAGESMSCTSGQKYDSGLCYPACPSGWTGIGPLCWEDCPAKEPYRMGLQCYKDKAERDGILSAVVIGTVAIALTLGAGAAYAGGFFASTAATSSMYAAPVLTTVFLVPSELMGMEAGELVVVSSIIFAGAV
jgi:hypothetical protein